MEHRTITTILKKWYQGTIEMLAIFPLLMTIGVLIIPEHLWVWIVSLLVFHGLGLILGRRLFNKPRYTQFGVGLLITSFIAVIVWMAFYNLYATGLIFISGPIVVHRGIKFRGMSWRQMLPPNALWIGLLLYFVVAAIYSLVPVLQAFFPYLAWIGLFYTIIALFIINSSQLRTASLPGGDANPPISSGIIRNNRILIILTLIIIIVVSNFNKLRQATVWLVKGVFQVILYVIIFLTNLMDSSPIGEDMGQDTGPMELLPGEVNEPSWILDLLEKVFMVVAGIILLVLIWYALKVLFKLLKRLYGLLLSFLRERVAFQEEAGFIDEKEKLIDFVDIGKEYVDRFQKWMEKLLEREPKWEQLVDNRERIRFLYRNFLLKAMTTGYRYKRHLTPKETGQDILDWDRDKQESKVNELTSIYEDIRYGEDVVEDNKVAELARAFLRR